MSGSKLAFIAAPKDATERREPVSVQRPTAQREGEERGGENGAGELRAVENRAAENRAGALREALKPSFGSLPASLRPPDWDESVDLSPEALAGTIGIVEAVLSSEQIAGLTTRERYSPMGPLGRGGMGRVDLAFDRALGRPVARKSVLRRRNAPLLVTEAQIGAQLEHPSLVPVYDVEVDANGRPSYTMRVVRGRTLRDVIEARRSGDKAAMTLAQVLGVFRQVCLAADYAHSRGVVHRDLKPENIIAGEFGEVYVLDWGVAYVSPASDLRASSQVSLRVAGTPGYMGPEQMLGAEVDARSDVFALGVILHELITGERPGEEGEETQVYAEPRAQRTASRPVRWAIRAIPAPFDGLVASCLAYAREERPASARLLADAIDEYLDGERARVEREREADAHAADGERAREAFDALDGESRALDAEAQELLAGVEPWDPAERKQPAWERAEQAERLRAEAARALARGEAAFTRALGRAPDHAAARRGLAALYFRQFEAAEANGDARKMAQYMDLARAYDDGPLAVQLRDEGLVEITSAPPGAEVTVARFEQRGLLLKAEHAVALGAAPVHRTTFASGSYVVIARLGETVLRCPLLVRRAHAHALSVRFENAREVPPGMILVPGGPFLALALREAKMVQASLPDFAIGRFPVTFREYVRFLDAIEDADERRRQTPEHRGRALVEPAGGGGWQLASHAVEGEGRKRIPEGRELDLPVFSVTWFQAAAFVRWLARTTGKPFHLPSDLEWEKAARGADGRAFPMGKRVDPSFAKLRESRPEATQPEPVGAFVHDESPYGVRDLAGGVGDWTSTAADGSSLEDLGLGAEDARTARERQAFYRGGHWGASSLLHMRYPTALGGRHTGIGFRLALSLEAARSSSLEVRPLA